MVSVALLQPDQSLIIHCGERKMTLKPKDIEARYLGERGRRGSLLPRNYRKVDRIEPEPMDIEVEAPEDEEGGDEFDFADETPAADEEEGGGEGNADFDFGEEGSPEDLSWHDFYQF